MTTPSGAVSTRALLVVAVLAGVLSLGLAWASALDLKWGTPYVTLGFCYTVYDSDGWASTQCDPMLVNYGYGLRPSTTFTGYQRPVRVLVVVAALLLAFGIRGRRPGLVRAGYGVAVAGLLVGGLRVYPGQVAYVIALVALGLWLHRTGAWNSSPAGRAPQPTVSRPGSAPRPPRP